MRGFTLIETVIYVAVLAAVSVIAAQTILLMHASLAEIRTTRTLSAAASVAMERIVRLARSAVAVNTGASVFASSPGMLALTGPGTPPASSLVFVDGGALVLEQSGNRINLTPPGVVVTSFLVRHITASTTSEGVKVETTFAAWSGRATTTQNFYTTVILRNSYAP